MRCWTHSIPFESFIMSAFLFSIVSVSSHSIWFKRNKPLEELLPMSHGEYHEFSQHEWGRRVGKSIFYHFHRLSQVFSFLFRIVLQKLFFVISVSLLCVDGCMRMWDDTIFLISILFVSGDYACVLHILNLNSRIGLCYRARYGAEIGTDKYDGSHSKCI